MSSVDDERRDAPDEEGGHGHNGQDHLPSPQRLAADVAASLTAADVLLFTHLSSLWAPDLERTIMLIP